jgi:hypothetical protein
VQFLPARTPHRTIPQVAVAKGALGRQVNARKKPRPNRRGDAIRHHTAVAIIQSTLDQFGAFPPANGFGTAMAQET